jgi:hypothetical protein
MSVQTPEADEVELIGEPTDAARQNQSDQDRRESQRYPVEGWAEVMMMDGTMMVRGQITDISSTGCFIESRGAFDLPLNCSVEMTFRINGVEFRPEGVTRVVKSGIGAGFLFLKMNSKLVMQLESLISLLTVHV